MEIKTSEKHKAIRAIRKFTQNQLRFPIEEVGPLNQEASRFKGVWLTPQGIHFHPGTVTPGHLAHEIGHWALIKSCDRNRLKPGCLSDQGIETFLSDIGAEAWGAELFKRLKLPIEYYLSETEDYGVEIKDPETWRLVHGVFLLQGTPQTKLLKSWGLFGSSADSWVPNERAWERYEDIKKQIGPDPGLLTENRE